MFFTKFDPMTEEAVLKAVDAQRRPLGEGKGYLAGKSFKARLDGEFAPEQLEYVFKDEETLTCTENGQTYDAPYNAITLGHITLFSHLVPGTTRGWHTVINWKTKAITVFETWFGVTVPVGGDMFGRRKPDHYRDVPREIQRQYSFGWADFGNWRVPRLRNPSLRLHL